MSKISIVVPIYNVEKYLENCIDSILGQTYTDIEVILVNDGSKDNSKEICTRYQSKDARIVYIEQENQGVSAARNHGKEIASGEYIIFIDADDELHPNMLENLYREMSENEADIAICGIQRIHDRSEIKETAKQDIDKQQFDQKQALDCYLTKGILEVGAWNKLFRKTVVDSVDFCVGRKMNEDKFFVFESILHAQKVVYSSEQLYYYYVRDNSATKQRFDGKWFDNIYFAERMYDETCKRYPDLEASARYQQLITKYYLLCTMNQMHATEEFHKEYQNLVKDIKNIRISDLTIRKSSKKGILLIKYCPSLFKALKK